MKRKIGFLSSLFKPKSLGVKILFAVALFLVIYLLYNRLTEEFSLLTEAERAVKDTSKNEDASQTAAQAKNEVGDRDDERKKASQKATEAQRVAQAKVAQARRAAALVRKTGAHVKDLASKVDAAKSTASTALKDAKTIGGEITKNYKKAFGKAFGF